MSDRLTAFSLALLLAAPLCYFLAGEIFEAEATAASPAPRALSSPGPLSLESVKRHAEGLQDRFASN